MSGVTFIGGRGSHLSGDDDEVRGATGVAGVTATVPGTGNCASCLIFCTVLALLTISPAVVFLLAIFCLGLRQSNFLAAVFLR